MFSRIVPIRALGKNAPLTARQHNCSPEGAWNPGPPRSEMKPGSLLGEKVAAWIQKEEAKRAWAFLLRFVARQKASGGGSSPRWLIGALMAHLVAASLAQAQVSHQVSVSGYVLPAFRLLASPPVTDSATVRAIVWETGPNEVTVEVIVRGDHEAATVTVPLWLRTNADHFILRANYRGPATEGYLSLGSPQASGDGLLVAPEALAGFQAQLCPFTPEMTLATGSRISLRGSFRSPNNALLSTLKISLAPLTGEVPQTFRFLLTLGD